MEIIVWIVFGAVAGWIASLLAGATDVRSISTDVIIGVVGALIGGFTMNLLGQTSLHGLNIYSLIVAVVGAVLILMTYKSITHQA